MFDTLVIVGVGLMGGSLGLAVRQSQLASRVVGAGRSPDRLQKAVDMGLIDQAAALDDESLDSADMIVVALPVERIAESVTAVRQRCSANCLITDLGSTKQAIVAAVENAGGRGEFVGSHPLAGDHRSGFAYSRADLYSDRVAIVTPTESSTAAAVERLEGFWRAVGSRVMTMDAAEHDRLLAQTSHAPHLAATAVAAATAEAALPLVASGWLDTTRVAAGDPELWRQIFVTNREAVVACADQAIANLQSLRDAVAAGDDQRLTELLVEGKRIRDAVGN